MRRDASQMGGTGLAPSLANALAAAALLWPLAGTCVQPLVGQDLSGIDWRLATLALSLAADAVGTFAFLWFGQHWSFKNGGMVYNVAMIMFNTVYAVLYWFWRDAVPVLSLTELLYTLYQYGIKRRHRTRQEQFYLAIHLFRALVLLTFMVRDLAPREFGVLVHMKHAELLVHFIAGGFIFLGLAYRQPFLVLGCFLVLAALTLRSLKNSADIPHLYSLISLITVGSGILVGGHK